MMGDCVDYAALRSSDLYKDFQNSTSELIVVDLNSYTEDQRKAFFISILFLVSPNIVCVPDAVLTMVLSVLILLHVLACLTVALHQNRHVMCISSVLDMGYSLII